MSRKSTDAEPPGPSDGPLLALRVANRLEEIGRVVRAFGEFAAQHALDDKARRTMNMVLDELLSNVVAYAHDGDGLHWIDVRIELDAGRLSATIENDGTPFDPFTRATPDTELSIEDRQIGGLGIHLVKSMMDEVSYVRSANRNVVTVVKRLTGTDQGNAEKPR